MQFCSVEGKAYTLHRTLQSRTLLLKNQEWFDVIIQLLEAFKLLHSSCLIHQDIKGDNILITYNNTMFVPVIIDFGKCIRKLDACKKKFCPKKNKRRTNKNSSTSPLKLSQALICHHMLVIFIPWASCWGRLQPRLGARPFCLSVNTA